MSDSCACYTTQSIQIFYIIASVLWLLLIYFTRILDNVDIVSMSILAIPIIVYLINYEGCTHFKKDSECDLFKGNYLSFAFLIAVIFINWNKDARNESVFRIMFIAIILIMVSLIDIWVDKDALYLFKHIKSSLQTAALTLLAFALYNYSLSI